MIYRITDVTKKLENIMNYLTRRDHEAWKDEVARANFNEWQARYRLMTGRYWRNNGDRKFI